MVHFAGAGVLKRAIIAMLCGAALLPAEIIDRLAVSVGNRAITVSDVERQLRVSAFLSGVKPDLGLENRRKAAEAMVDQKLVSRELETARYPEPESTEIVEIFAEFKSKYFPNDADYRAALAEHGITEADVKEQLLWQRRWLSFVGVRFRPAVQVSEQDVREYFEKTVLPAALAANPGATFTLDEFRDQILTKLTGDRVDQQMEQWLGDMRGRVEIVFHEEAFGAASRTGGGR
jgi:peptidyl-prolyl cis-trans isomerase SurA